MHYILCRPKSVSGIILASFLYANDASGQEDENVSGEHFSNATSVAASMAEQYGLNRASDALRRINRVDTAITLANNIRDRDVGGTINTVVSSGVAVFSVPIGVAAGAPLGPVGSFGGGYVGVEIANSAGNRAENLYNDTAERFRDTRSPLTRRMDNIGFDPVKYLGPTSTELSAPGGFARYEIDKRRELLRRERELAERNGLSYFPDAFILQEISDLERTEALEQSQFSGNYEDLQPQPSRNAGAGGAYIEECAGEVENDRGRIYENYADYRQRNPERRLNEFMLKVIKMRNESEASYLLGTEAGSLMYSRECVIKLRQMYEEKTSGNVAEAPIESPMINSSSGRFYVAPRTNPRDLVPRVFQFNYD